MVHGGPAAPTSKAASVTIDVHGDIAPEKRRAAFEKSNQELVSRPNRENFKSDAGFELAKAEADYQLAKYELIVADASQAHAAYTVSHEKKGTQFEGEVVAAKDTALAKVISRIGKEPDAFAGIATENADLVANINVPLDPAVARQMKTVAEKIKAAADHRIDNSSRVEQDQKADDKQFAELLFQVASDVAEMDTLNGVVRIWRGSQDKLTTLSATRVQHGEKYRELVRKFKHAEAGPKKIQGVEVHKLTNVKLEKDAPELFGAEGAVYVATGDKAVWVAAGPEAMQRLEQAIEAASPGKGAATGGRSGKQAIDVHGNLQALAAAWDTIGMRLESRPDSRKNKSEEKSAKEPKAAKRTEKATDAGTGKSDRKADTKKPVTAATVSDLDLHKIAGESFKHGEGKFTISLTGDGDKAKLLMTGDEDMLRFVGNVLSKFTKENLED
jgi:hypothetical protein